MKKNFAISIIWIAILLMFTSTIQAKMIEVSVSHKTPAYQYMGPSGVYRASVRSASLSSEEPEKWTVTANNDVALMSTGELFLPVQKETPSITLYNKNLGQLVVSSEGVRAVSRVPVVEFQYQEGQTFNYRPTLFVSIGGFKLEATNDGSGTEDWQFFHMEKKIFETIKDTYQYRHFVVDWDTHATNTKQVKDLANVIKNFLRERTEKWDVVLVGHSRGAIFAHDLTRELVGNSHLDTLFTYLLDPTASGAFQDFYPSHKYTSSSTTHYADAYFDNKKLTSTSGFGTISDEPISGYTSHNFSAISHGIMPYEWFYKEFDNVLSFIKSHKDTGSFVADTSILGGHEVTKISRPEGLTFTGNIETNAGEVRLYGEFSLNGNPLTTANLDATVGSSGVEIYAAASVVAAQAVFTTDVVSVAASTPVSNFSASVTGDGVYADFASATGLYIIDANVGVNIDFDEISKFQIELGIGDFSITDKLPTSGDISRETTNFFHHNLGIKW